MTAPAGPLSKRLDELGQCWLELRGRCQIVYVPLPLMVRRYGGALVLRDVVTRLRCSKLTSPWLSARKPRAGTSEGWRIVPAKSLRRPPKTDERHRGR